MKIFNAAKSGACSLHALSYFIVFSFYCISHINHIYCEENIIKKCNGVKISFLSSCMLIYFIYCIYFCDLNMNMPGFCEMCLYMNMLIIWYHHFTMVRPWYFIVKVTCPSHSSCVAFLCEWCQSVYLQIECFNTRWSVNPVPAGQERCKYQCLCLCFRWVPWWKPGIKMGFIRRPPSTNSLTLACTPSVRPSHLISCHPRLHFSTAHLSRSLQLVIYLRQRWKRLFNPCFMGFFSL